MVVFIFFINYSYSIKKINNHYFYAFILVYVYNVIKIYLNKIEIGGIMEFNVKFKIKNILCLKNNLQRIYKTI